MKKSLLALAVLGAFAGAASAQTNVTLYGIADIGVQSYDNDGAAGRTTRLSSGGQSTSRIGFRGTEELGSGMKANFVLEQGITVDDGGAAAGFQFSRLAYVGLQGGFGSVTLGKQISPLKDAHDKIDPYGGAGTIGSIEQIFYNGSMAAASGDSNGRPANTIKYALPNFGGFSASTSYTFGEAVGSTATGRSVGVNVGYENGPLTVQFGAADVAAPVSPVVAATVLTDNQTWFLGAAYNFGIAKLYAAYADYNYETAAGVTTTEGRNALIGVTVPFGASALVATYARNDVRASSAPTFGDSDRLALMYTYDMSKRTNFYVGATYTKNDAGASLLSGTAPTGVSIASGADPKAFAVGVRHRF